MVALNSIVLLCKQITILHFFFLPFHSLLIIIVVVLLLLYIFLIINCQLSEKILKL